MRVGVSLLVVSLLTGCVFAPQEPDEPSPPTPPLTENPSPEPPRTRPTGPAPSPTPTIPGPSLSPAPPSPTPPTPSPDEEPSPAPGEEWPGEITTGWVPPERDRDRSPARLVRFEPGLDEPDGTFVRSWSQADDGVGFVAQLGAVADATVRIDSLARLASRASTPATIVLDADTITDPSVTLARVGIWDEDDALVGELDLLAAEPALEGTLPPGATYDLSWTIGLAEGATEDVVVAVRLSVSS